MKAIVRGRWVVLLAWVVATVVLVMTAPNMAQLVREKGQITVPDGYSSSLASELLKEVQKQENKEGEMSAVLVFHRKERLQEKDWKEIEKAVEQLQAKKESLGLIQIVSPLDDGQLKEKLVSKDGTTVLVSLQLERNKRTAKEISTALYEAIEHIDVPYYYTGSWMIDEDVVQSSQEGLKKTEGITVVFILVVLFLVFRSLVAPFVPLLTVGLTYIVSQAIVAFLVDRVDFPLSTFTQTFLVAVLFGIGTDYCILLLSRFKEELAKREDRTEAIIATYKTAGKTVIFSGLAVMIGFASIGLSTFKLYQSASAVAVGVVVLLVALVTLVPFFMATLGEKLFWPMKGALEHKPSKLWDVAGRFSFARPLWALAIVAIITLPILLTYDGKLSFNSMAEIGDRYASVKAFNIISAHFSEGEAMPTKIVMKNDEAMDDEQYYYLIEKISREVANIDGVEAVRSVTRPLGEPIDQLFVTKQAEQLKDGLGKGADGIGQIRSGLSEASSEMAKSAPKLEQATGGIRELVNGTSKLKTGMTDLQQALKQLEDGVRSGAIGAADLEKGLQTIQTNMKKLHDGADELRKGYEQATGGLRQLSERYEQIESGLQAISEQLPLLSQSLNRIEERHTGLREDAEYAHVKQAVQQMSAQMNTLSDALVQVNDALQNVQRGLQQANESFATITNGQQALITGMDEVISGLGKLRSGLEQAADGQGQIVQRLPEVTNGLAKVNDGQQQLLTGFSQLNGQMDQLISGLNQSVNGLRRVEKGLQSAKQYVSDLANAPDEEMAGWYMPPQLLTSEEFAQAKEEYMSKDGKVITFDVVFSSNPYETTTMEKIAEVKEAIARAVNGTKLEHAKVGVGGVTSIYSDLRDISAADYARTSVFMLVGIAVILIILLRSFIMPVYLMLSLILTYYTSMAFTELVFVDVLGYEGINWAVPFFAFVILMALGIDYSIFLMDRFNEYRDKTVQEAMLEAMRHMGTVIISAAIILGGTFAAMYPSGVLSLLQIATIILTGLFLYALVVLPLFIPVMVKTFGRANWWPFMK
ncbi:efflux RND transporter permease subunit [Anoxybacillus sp. FSL W8-1294]|uniref:MMPL/RND family transporter n=1 Tax=Anoxybacillus sp. FSL W8-1294 TaxID=2954655 RepID=UPI0030CC2343